MGSINWGQLDIWWSSTFEVNVNSETDPWGNGFALSVACYIFRFSWVWYIFKFFVFCFYFWTYLIQVEFSPSCLWNSHSTCFLCFNSFPFFVWVNIIVAGITPLSQKRTPQWPLLLTLPLPQSTGIRTSTPTYQLRQSKLLHAIKKEYLKANIPRHISN